MRRIALLFCLSLPLLSAGCKQPLPSLTPPSIVAAVPAFGSANPTRTLTAAFNPGNGIYEVVSIQAVVNRDRDPSRFAFEGAPRFPADSIPTSAGVVTVTLPASFTLATAQLLSVQWIIGYRLRGGTEVVDAESAVVGTRLDCAAGSEQIALIALQTRVLSNPAIPTVITGSEGFKSLLSEGYVPSHGWRSFPGMGVALYRPGPGPSSLFASASALYPSLLLYAPPDGNVTDVREDDGDYRLIGFAMAGDYAPGTPPALGCIPREAWFVHEAGWHPSNGGFIPETIRENSPGAANPSKPATLPPRPPNPGAVFTGHSSLVPPVWHPRLWDLHVWLGSSGTPSLSMCNNDPPQPPPAQSLFYADPASCSSTRLTPTGGSPFPPAGFLVPELPR